MKIEKLTPSVYPLRSAEELETEQRHTFSADAIAFEGERRGKQDQKRRQNPQEELELSEEEERTLSLPKKLGILDIVV